jgi:hypothetical protein
MFFTALLMSRLVSWMRKQPGTGALRALVYLDEAYGFCPPTKNPPSKKPIMTLLKQARAHGLGVIVATQNPVDLDYKAMSNCGTWLVGTLRTKQDRARIIDAVGESVGLDKKVADHRIASLGKREFMLLDATGRAEQFRSRYALCLLRGPLTREEIASLSGPQKIGTVSGHVVGWHNRSLNIYSKPGESRRGFVNRCQRLVLDDIDPKYTALNKRYKKGLMLAHSDVVSLECEIGAAEEMFQSMQKEHQGRAALGVFGGMFGRGGMGAWAVRAVRPGIGTQRKQEKELENIRRKRMGLDKARRSLALLEEELQEQIEAITQDARERVLDISEVKA